LKFVMILYFGPEVVRSFYHICQVVPSAQEWATHVGMHAKLPTSLVMLILLQCKFISMLMSLTKLNKL